MKVTVMGVEIDPDTLPDAPPTIDFHFAPVRLTPAVINIASQKVPDEAWIAKGIYTWLQDIADEAWKKVPVGELEYQARRIRFIFERDGNTPVLVKIVVT